MGRQVSANTEAHEIGLTRDALKMEPITSDHKVRRIDGLTGRTEWTRNFHPPSRETTRRTLILIDKPSATIVTSNLSEPILVPVLGCAHLAMLAEGADVCVGPTRAHSMTGTPYPIL